MNDPVRSPVVRAARAWAELPARARAGLLAGAVVVGWAVLDALLPRGLPFGIVVLGAVFGSLNALVAIGIVLVYRANRVVNFAQAELGSVAAVLAIQFKLQLHWNYLVAIVAGLVVAVLMGAVIDLTVVRRFRQAPRLIVAVATIGLAQILLGLSLLIPLWWSDFTGTAERFEAPFSARVEISPVVFNANHLVAMVVVPLVLVGLTLFFTRTDYGVAIRAAPENPDRANLLGIPVARLSTMVWALAGFLSALAIIVRVPILGFTSFSSVSGGGPSLLLRTLAAAVIGRMESMPLTAGAAIGLGIVGELTAWTFSSSTYVDAVMVGIVLLALLAQRGTFSRASEAAVGSWRAFREVRPIPAELRRLPEVRLGLAALWVALGAVVLLYPLVAPPSREQLAALIFIYAILAVSLVILTGWAGQISLGHFALAGFGGTTAGVLVMRWDQDLFVAIPAGMVVAAGAAVVIGLPALRVSGPFFAVTTLGFAVTSATLFLEDRHFGWFVQDRVDRPVLWQRVRLDADWKVYYLSLAGLALAVLATRNLRRTRTGRALVAVRDNPLAAQAVSIDTRRLTIKAFAISGAMAGLAGSLYVLHQNGLKTDAFGPEVSLRLFSMVVIGGLGSVPGAILGATYVRGAEFFLTGAWSLVASGGALLLLLMLLPGGLGELLYRCRDGLLRMVARRRGLIVPSLLADVAADSNAEVPLPLRAAVPDASAPAPAPPVPGGRRWRRSERGAPALTPDQARAQGLLVVRGLEVAYDHVQVLFGVDLEVHDGEVLALLGANGAGKSTTLRAVSGLVEPVGGRVFFDGHDITRADANDTAALGIVQVPGGRGVFPALSVADNLRVGGWLHRHDAAYRAEALERVLEHFPILRKRFELPAGDLSGGEQQMLSLGLAFLARPRLLLIDELSLGLAPTVVQGLVGILRDIHAQGTTILLVEQSVNTALELAERAVFMEKGEVRFTGSTRELLERPDVLRAVYLEGAAAAVAGNEPTGGGGGRRPAAERRRRAALMEAPVALETVALTKRYGGITAVAAVDLQLHQGEILGLIGPNGAGKTTLYDLVSGFQPADGGRVLLHGVDVSEHWAAARAAAGLGRSFQDSRLWPSLTVSEALAVAFERQVEVRTALAAVFGLAVVTDAEARVAEQVGDLLELLHLGAFRDKFVGELSTGSRRIVEIAATVAHRPSVLLLDEPSSGIAQRETEALLPFLRQIRDHLDCSLLVIEHDMPLITGLADRIVALDSGGVIAEGTPEEIVRHPRVVESYLGTLADRLQVAGAGPRPRRRRAKAGT